MYRYGSNEFSGVKNTMFDLIDAETDAQRNVVTHTKYCNKQLGLLDRRMSEKNWKFQLKYSVRLTDKCLAD